MSTKPIEKVLNNSFGIIEYDVNLKGSVFTIELDIEAPRDNQDWNNLMLLKNKLRSITNKVYKLKFILEFTT